MNRQDCVKFHSGISRRVRGKSLIRKAEKTTVSYELFKILLVALQSGTYYCNIYVDGQIDEVSCVIKTKKRVHTYPCTTEFNKAFDRHFK